MSAGDLAGQRIARAFFKKRGNRSEAHVGELELAALLSLAYGLGKGAVEGAAEAKAPAALGASCYTKGALEVGDEDRNGQTQILKVSGGQLVAVATHECIGSREAEAKANAEEIVRRWNAHEDLVAVLQEIFSLAASEGDIDAETDWERVRAVLTKAGAR